MDDAAEKDIGPEFQYVSLLNTDSKPTVEGDQHNGYYVYEPTLVSNVGLASIVLDNLSLAETDPEEIVATLENGKLEHMKRKEAKEKGFMGLMIEINHPSRRRNIATEVIITGDGKHDLLANKLMNHSEEEEVVGWDKDTETVKIEPKEGTRLMGSHWNEPNLEKSELGVKLYVNPQPENLKSLKFRFNVIQGGEQAA